VVNKSSWTLIGHFCVAIGQHGKPYAIRTDNELSFKSAWFKTLLKLVGIRHQRIPVCAPWCNGHIESFIGRIKPFIGQIDILSPFGLQNALEEIRHFFNQIPAEACAGLCPTDLARTPPKSTQLAQALDGLQVERNVKVFAD
jgi:transposase InsO family protein